MDDGSIFTINLATKKNLNIAQKNLVVA